MYLDYFSLDRHPFRITPDTSLFFAGGQDGRGVVLDAMLYAIESGEGILKVVGEVGSGKTMLCRMLEERLPDSTELVYLANPRLTPEDILYAIAFELKLPVRRDTSKLLVMQHLQNYLLQQHARNRKVLVIIEEAQGMAVETLEEIRLFSNLETHRDKLMQIVLFGQPELDKNLKSRSIRQLKERITHSFSLPPLSRKSVSEYIRFRLGAAGCPCPSLFTPQAEWLIWKASGGLTRRINILADKALLAAFAENVLPEDDSLHGGSPAVVRWRHVSAAIRDSEYTGNFLPALLGLARPMPLAALALVFAMVSSGLPAKVVQADSRSILATITNWQALRDRGVTLLQDTRNAVSGFSTDEAPVASAAQLEAESLAAAIDLEERVELKPRLTPLYDRALGEMLHGATVSPAHDRRAPSGAFLPTHLISSGTQPGPSEGLVAPVQEQIDETPRVMPGSLVQQRLLAAIEWLQREKNNGYTIQFLSGTLGNLEFAEIFLQQLVAEGLLNDAYVCMSTVRGESYWTIKYGSFEGASMAQEFVEGLPEQIRDYQPFAQNISGLQCNINQLVASN